MALSGGLLWRVFRLLFFGLLAADALWKFTGPTESSSLLVSKIPLLFEEGLDWVPTPKFLARISGVVCLAAAVASLGPERFYPRAAAVAAAGYNIAYFGDTTDRYQHHYLLCLLLALLPWARDHAWVKRLVFVQLALVYFWTGVAKIVDGGLFLEGHFVRMAARRRIVFDGVHWLSELTGIDDISMWSLLAVQVVLFEVVLCGLLLTGRAPRLAVVLGVAMHLGFELVGKLSIGYFSWYMLTLYILVVPQAK